MMKNENICHWAASSIVKLQYFSVSLCRIMNMTVTDDRGKYLSRKILKSCKVLLSLQNNPETVVVLYWAPLPAEVCQLECFITSVCLKLCDIHPCWVRRGVRKNVDADYPIIMLSLVAASAQPGILMGSPVLHLITVMNCGWISK